MRQRLHENDFYIPLSTAERYDLLCRFWKLFDEFVKALGYDVSKLSCRIPVLYEMLERVEKRKVYFHIFYEGKVMSEQNETSLSCFWLLKLAPFFDEGNKDRNINATFATYWFLKMIRRVNHVNGQSTKFNPKYVNNLRYAFLYRDISKEAIMLAADTLLAYS